MTGLKRIGLFLLVNALVILTISVIMSTLGVKPYLTKYGLDYQSLIIFCLIWGMGGAFISLALSRITAKWMMAKLGIWLLFTIMAGLLTRKKLWAKPVWIITLLLGGVAAYLAGSKPF